MALELILRWAHILCAVILIGGIFFLRCVMLPAMSAIRQEDRVGFEAACRSTWAKLVMITSGVLLATGLYNAVQIIIHNTFPANLYHGLVAVKLLLAMGIFFITAILAGRTSLADRFRAKGAFWFNVNVVLAIALILVAGLMKTSVREPKPVDESATRAALHTSAFGDLHG